VSQTRRDDDRKVKVCVIDTGLDGSHPFFESAPWENDLGRRVRGCIWFDEAGEMHQESDWHSWRMEKGKQARTEGYVDEDGHGTHCAGLILQVARNCNLYVAQVSGHRDQEPDPTYVARVRIAYDIVVRNNQLIITGHQTRCK
jgi:subtilisin family serine protease